MSRPFSITRTFDGKRYSVAQNGMFRSKLKAKSRAKQLRGSGKKARIIKVKQGYVVYERR